MERRRTLGLFSLKKKMLTEILSTAMGKIKKTARLLIGVVFSERIRGSQYKLKYRKFYVNIRKQIPDCDGAQTRKQVLERMWRLCS